MMPCLSILYTYIHVGSFSHGICKAVYLSAHEIWLNSEGLINQRYEHDFCKETKKKPDEENILHRRQYDL